MKLQSYLNNLPASISNEITNCITRGVGISRWDNRLLGISSLPIRTILDIGANQGQSTKKLAAIFPGATIHAFEPVKAAFAKLEKTIEKQKNRIIAYNYAIGEGDGKVILNDYESASQASSLLSITPEIMNDYPVFERVKRYPVKQKSIDNLSLSIKSDCLIKIDVQGYEAQVILGGKNTFSQAKCCIVEVNNERSYEDQCDFRTLFGLLDSLGLQYRGNIDQVQAKDGSVKYFDAVFIRP